MSKVSGYKSGVVYSLAEIKPVTERLKFVSSKFSESGTIYLYREKETNLFWMSGPFQGKDSNTFIFLGLRKSKDELRDFMTTALRETVIDICQSSLVQVALDVISGDDEFY